jgi:hypothetical protein
VLGGRFVELEGGHGLTEERPQELNAAILGETRSCVRLCRDLFGAGEMLGLICHVAVCAVCVTDLVNRAGGRFALLFS